MNDEQFLREVARDLAGAGLRGSVVVRDLLDGRELSIAPDVVWPLASVAKLPLATAVLLLATDGRLDLGRPVELPAGPEGASAGTDRFRHAATIAADDLLTLAMTVSDNRAADALLALVGVEEAQQRLADAGIRGFTLRRPFRDLGRTPLGGLGSEGRDLLQTLALRAGAPDLGHPIAQLDVARTNTGSARALADLLTATWSEDELPAAVTGRLRQMLGAGLLRQRLAPDLESDDARWSSKTGTSLHLRHEAGVLEHADGDRYAIVLLSRSDVPASVQPAADQALGAAARALHDRLRERG